LGGAFESVTTQEDYLWVEAVLRAWLDKFNTIIAQYGLKRVSNHSIFVWHSSAGSIVLTVYVNDIVIYGDG